MKSFPKTKLFLLKDRFLQQNQSQTGSFFRKNTQSQSTTLRRVRSVGQMAGSMWLSIEIDNKNIHDTEKN